MRTSMNVSLRVDNGLTTQSAPNANRLKRSVTPAACLIALALLAGTASAQWSATILSPESGNGYSRANCVFGNRQGGSIDDGYQAPLVWQGTFASQTELPYQLDAGAEVSGLSATHAVGSGYFRFTEFDGFYTGIMWDLSTNSYTLLNVPDSPESEVEAISGSTQVGRAYIDDEYHPVLWRGTSESWRSLLPIGYLSGSAYDVDGNAQVGEVYNGEQVHAALWNGTAASFVSLHPLGWDESVAEGVWGSQQAGSVYRILGETDEKRAAVWSGTAASFFDLHPPCAYRSEATAISMGRVVGNIRLDQDSEEFAAYWPYADSTDFVNLVDLLPSGQYLTAEANDIWTDGDGVVYIVGEAQNVNFNSEAVMWTFTGGGCIVDGVQTIVPNAAACSGTYLGAGRYQGFISGCCFAPLGSQAAGSDKDGDFIIDSCIAPLPAGDCDSDGNADSLQTLDISSYLTTPDWVADFTFYGTADYVSEGIQLTDSLEGQLGSVISSSRTLASPYRAQAVFDFRIDNTPVFPADGLSFAILDSQVHGTPENFGEQGPGAGSIAVKFNTYANFPEEGSNSMELLYDGVLVERVTQLPLSLVSNDWRRAVINLSADGKVTVTLATNANNITTVLNQVQLPNYVPYSTLRTGFGARTGDFANRHTIRNYHIGFSNALDANGDGIPDSCSLPSCFADYNQDGGIDGSDIEAFFTDWEAGSPSADTNLDGGIDGSDVEIFFLQWEAGAC